MANTMEVTGEVVLVASCLVGWASVWASPGVPTGTRTYLSLYWLILGMTAAMGAASYAGYAWAQDLHGGLVMYADLLVPLSLAFSVSIAFRIPRKISWQPLALIPALLIWILIMVGDGARGALSAGVQILGTGFVVFGIITNWKTKPAAQQLVWQLVFMFAGLAMKMVVRRPVGVWGGGDVVVSGNWLMHVSFAVANIFLGRFATALGQMATQAQAKVAAGASARREKKTK